MDTQGSTPTEFTLFGKLSPELRLRIWELAIPDQRIIRIQYRRLFVSLLDRDMPVMMRVSHEARSVAVKHYSSCTVMSLTDKQKFYFSFDRDILCFANHFSIHEFLFRRRESNVITRQIRHIILAAETDTNWPVTIIFASAFQALESFTCLLQNYDTRNESELEKLKAMIEEEFRRAGAARRANKNIPTVVFRHWDDPQLWFSKNT
jgi:hypothetical protein